MIVRAVYKVYHNCQKFSHATNFTIFCSCSKVHVKCTFREWHRICENLDPQNISAIRYTCILFSIIGLKCSQAALVHVSLTKRNYIRGWKQLVNGVNVHTTCTYTYIHYIHIRIRSIHQLLPPTYVIVFREAYMKKYPQTGSRREQ